MQEGLDNTEFFPYTFALFFKDETSDGCSISRWWFSFQGTSFRSQAVPVLGEQGLSCWSLAPCFSLSPLIGFW